MARPTLRYPIDLWPLALVAATFGLCALPLFHRFEPLALAAYWLALFTLRRIATAAQHGHAHLSVFRSRALNAVYDFVLAHETGLTTAEWDLHHVRGHHRDYRDPALDVFSVYDRETGQRRSRLRYSLEASLGCWGDSLRIASEQPAAARAQWRARFWRQAGAQVSLIAAMVWINPAMGLLFAVAQTFAVRCSVAWSSYWHHLEVPMTSVYDSSRTLPSPLHNWISFNSGHHTAHHEKPTLHWSLLPARTRAIRHLIPDACVRVQDAPAALSEDAPAADSAAAPATGSKDTAVA